MQCVVDGLILNALNYLFLIAPLTTYIFMINYILCVNK